MELTCDVLILGGGCGGVAAALAASDLGCQVVLTEAGSFLGGQLTSQAVPPDEHPWVESTGTTARYRQLRDAVRPGQSGASIKGRVVDVATKAPVAGARVRLTGSSQRGPVLTDEAGAFVFSGLKGGTYSFFVERNGGRLDKFRVGQKSVF